MKTVAPRLTSAQLDALSWIDKFPSHEARWMRKGRLAFGPPNLWDAMELTGHRGSIRIPTADWEAIVDLIEAAPKAHRSMWTVNDTGKRALGIS